MVKVPVLSDAMISVEPEFQPLVIYEQSNYVWQGVVVPIERWLQWQGDLWNRSNRKTNATIKPSNGCSPRTNTPTKEK